MNLNVRLGLSIIAPCLLVLIGGTALIIANARQAVSQEIEASAGLVLQLLTAATLSSDVADRAKLFAALSSSLGSLRDIRHLNIALLDGESSILLPATAHQAPGGVQPPAWFAELVAPPPQEYRRRFSGPGLPYAEIAVRADARDEIAEVWRESRVALGLLILFALLAISLIHLMVTRTLRPLERIVEGLTVIERGDYAARLPRFELPELQRISAGFNRMAEVLQTQRSDNRQLTRRSLAIQENERRHLAQELHDELGQSISAIKAMAVSIARQPATAGTGAADSATSIVSVSDRVYAVIRGMMHRLRPAVVDELGLELGLERMIDDWNAHHEDTFCTLSIDGALDGLGADVQIGVYRVIQEALTNVARHAAAATVSVALAVEQAARAGQLSVQIRDDGAGFDPGVARQGLGVPGMRERIEALGGELDLSAAPGKGVTIRCRVPIDAAGSAEVRA